MKLKWDGGEGQQNIAKLLKSGAALAELDGGTDSARNFGYGQKHSNRPGPHDQEVNDDGTKKGKSNRPKGGQGGKKSRYSGGVNNSDTTYD